MESKVFSVYIRAKVTSKRRLVFHEQLGYGFSYDQRLLDGVCNVGVCQEDCHGVCTGGVNLVLSKYCVGLS